MARRNNYGYCHACNDNELKRIAARGLCEKHYQRWRRHGNVSDPDYINSGKQCSVDGCERDAVSKGMCNMHYDRAEKHGDPEIVMPRGNHRPPMAYDSNMCVVHDCRDDIVAQELCYKHYHNYMYHLRQRNVLNIFDYLRLRKDNPIKED